MDGIFSHIVNSGRLVTNILLTIISDVNEPATELLPNENIVK